MKNYCHGEPVALRPFDKLTAQGDREGDKKTVMVSASLATGASGASSRTILRQAPHATALDKQDDGSVTIWATGQGA